MDYEKDQLIRILPIFIYEQMKYYIDKSSLLEIVMDLGRFPQVRFQNRSEDVCQRHISWKELEFTLKKLKNFTSENRSGLEHTLHRISCIRNRRFLINGLTCRIGRGIFGSISLIRDLLEAEQSILILGPPGVGKTTIIREISRILANEMGKRVIIIDTSNEIGGDCDIPHSSIGRARRMQVSKPELQHKIMLEAVENHMPQVIVVDEITTQLEVLAAQTIGEKGIQLIGTTHGSSLENLVKNPIINNLIGGIQSVILSDDEAKRRGTQKTIIERHSYPTFQIAIEINKNFFWVIHENIKCSIDLLLKNKYTVSQIRNYFSNKKVCIHYKKNWLLKENIFFKKLQDSDWLSVNNLKNKNYIKKSKIIIIYLYSISKNFLKEISLKFTLKYLLTKDLKSATIIIGSTKLLLKNIPLQKYAERNNINIYKLDKINIYQGIKLFLSL